MSPCLLSLLIIIQPIEFIFQKNRFKIFGKYNIIPLNKCLTETLMLAEGHTLVIVTCTLTETESLVVTLLLLCSTFL